MQKVGARQTHRLTDTCYFKPDYLTEQEGAKLTSSSQLSFQGNYKSDGNMWWCESRSDRINKPKSERKWHGKSSRRIERAPFDFNKSK